MQTKYSNFLLDYWKEPPWWLQ